MLKPQQLKERVTNALWSVDLAGLPAWERLLVRAMRIAYVVVRDLADGQLTLRAMSLVYTTLLSLVPLLAVSFSVLKAFGVHNQIEPLLLNLLAPLGEKGLEITRRIIQFVENVKAGVLGSLGLALLIYTVVSLIQKVERAFNFTWHVTHERPFSQRFSDYLSVIVIGPVLVFAALGITASVMSTSVVRRLSAIQPFGCLLAFGGRVIPYLLVIAAFAFIYVFVPNTRVRARSALAGAVVAGVLWETTGWVFASFIAGSARYTVIYSTFAGLILFMIWLYSELADPAGGREHHLLSPAPGVRYPPPDGIAAQQQAQGAVRRDADGPGGPGPSAASRGVDRRRAGSAPVPAAGDHRAVDPDADPPRPAGADRRRAARLPAGACAGDDLDRRGAERDTQRRGERGVERGASGLRSAHRPAVPGPGTRSRGHAARSNAARSHPARVCL